MTDIRRAEEAWRPFIRCGHVGPDGCCQHPENMTPECHAEACPIAPTPPVEEAEVQAKLFDARHALAMIALYIPKGEVDWEKEFYKVRDIARAAILEDR